MNNASASFTHTAVNNIPGSDPRTPYKEFLFNDHSGRGTFLLKEMRLELFKNGRWHFYIAAEGIHATTILKNGRTCGPELFMIFKDKKGALIEETSLGQVNYGCKDDAVYTYISKGVVEVPENIAAIEIRYDAFLDFACGKVKE